MVIRVGSVPDDTELTDLYEIFQALLDWNLDLGYSFRIHGQEFNNFRRKTRPQPLRAFQLHRHEKFQYIADTLPLWEWEIRVLDVDAGTPEDRQPRCLLAGGPLRPKGAAAHAATGSCSNASKKVPGSVIRPSWTRPCSGWPRRTWSSPPRSGTSSGTGGRVSIAVWRHPGHSARIASIFAKPMSDWRYTSAAGGWGDEDPGAAVLR